MSTFIRSLVARAKRAPQRVAFPESMNPEILETCARVVAEGVGSPVLFGVRREIEALAAAHGVSIEGFSYVDCADEAVRRELANAYTARFEDFTEKSVVRKAKDPIRCALFLLKLNRVDCVAAGKERSTGDVIFETMSIIGLQQGVESVSSLGLAEIPGFAGPEGTMLGLADCAITSQPDARDLASIATASADTVRALLNWEPRVAMLAYSTCGSAEHESLEPIREAISLVRAQRPDIKIDGEFQMDAAIVPAVAAKKVPRESEVAGRANVLIFPNLHAGNIGVKMIQIFGQANAYGPMLQGFAQPVCDFSRSAPVDEMFGNVVMLIIRAGSVEASCHEL